MGRRWYYWKRMLRANGPALGVTVGVFLACAWMILGGIAGTVPEGGTLAGVAAGIYESCGVRVVTGIMEQWFPVLGYEEEGKIVSVGTEFLAYLEEQETIAYTAEDPAYARMLEREWERNVLRENDAYMEDTGELVLSGTDEHNADDAERNGRPAADGTPPGDAIWQADHNTGGSDGSGGGAEGTGYDVGAAEVISTKTPAPSLIREKLADYDYTMKHFYSVHTTAAAGREMIDAERFLAMDFAIGRESDEPQILIYHTHSQEEYADYPENPEATIVGVGAELARLLRERGYNVIHDTRVYDVRDGKLDRSQAYTYALDGISGILQEHPSIEVVLDLHRDGVAEGTRLVTEVDGRETAKIMFFNGTSQTPDGPIEYLPNPNREANLAFSFQMQMEAAERYPGLTRKIYLKGLRYNQHVRARTSLIEVGAQTNRYAEAVHAMGPLADILDRVIGGSGDGSVPETGADGGQAG